MNLKEIAGKFFKKPEISPTVRRTRFSEKEVLEILFEPIPTHLYGRFMHPGNPIDIAFWQTQEKTEVLVTHCDVCPRMFMRQPGDPSWIMSKDLTTEFPGITPLSKKEEYMGNNLEGPKNPKPPTDENVNPEPFQNPEKQETTVQGEPETPVTYDPNSPTGGFYEGYDSHLLGS